MAASGRRLLVGGVRFYNAKPLKRRLDEVYRPDPANPRTPAWQLTAAYEAKRFGRYGEASGVSPAQLWPTPEQLREAEDEERRRPSLREMQRALEAQEREAEAARRQREEIIAAKMAKMPQMIENWLREKQQRKVKEEQEKERRRLLLAEARELFGYHVDHYSAEFQELVQEREKMRKMERKQEKQQRMEEFRAKRAAESKGIASPADNEKVAEQDDT